jgi:autotransporter-associated beta strand protein
VIFTGNNTYLGQTWITNSSTLVIGNGTTVGTIGKGTINMGGTAGTTFAYLVYNHSDNVNLTNDVTGAGGSVIQEGSGVLTLSYTNNMYTGPTVVSNGELVVNGTLGGDLDIEGGALEVMGDGSVSNLVVDGNLNINAGTLLISLNKSLSPSNSLLSVAGTAAASGGKLKLVNYGPALVAGDVFTVSSEAITGGAGMSIVSPGVTVVNNLASNGSVQVQTVASSGPTVTETVSGGNVHLSWPAIWTGLHVQVQTDAPGTGITSTNWVTIAGSDASNTYSAAVTTNNVFYRLAP